MLIVFCIAILLFSAAAGAFAGKKKEKKTYRICGGIMLLLTLISAVMAVIFSDTVEPVEQFRSLRNFGVEELDRFWARAITSCRLFMHFIIFDFLLACILFFTSLNCFKNFKKIWQSITCLILSCLGGTMLLMFVFSTFFIFITLLIPCKTDYFSMSYGEVGIYAIYCTLIFALLWVIDRTFIHHKLKVYQAVLLYIAVVFIVYLAGILTALNCRRLMNKKAANLNIRKMSLQEKNPPEYEKFRRSDFYEKYPLYSPPLSGIYSWKRNEIDQERKNFTLKFFDSQAVHDFIKEHEKIIPAIANYENYFLGTAQYFRNLTRLYCGRAILFKEVKKYDKILPELMRYIDADKKITAENPWLINFLVLAACRNIWYENVQEHAPDGAQYAQFYRQMLEYSKTWQIHLPHEAGFYLGLKEYEKLHGFSRFYCKPILIAAQCRGFFHILKTSKKLQTLKEQEVFVFDRKEMFSSAAYHQRCSIVESQIIFALKCYRAEHGRYPEKLAELVPHYLAKIPPSPTSGGSINYHLKNKNFILDIGKIL